jgi:hypothetical protein
MMDRPMSGLGKSLAVTAVAFALVGVGSQALADEPTDKKPVDERATPAASPPPSAPVEGAAAGAQAGAAPQAGVSPPGPRAGDAGLEAVKPLAGPATPSGEAGPGPRTESGGGEEAAASWFARAPLALSIGQGEKKWTMTFYGFVEADFIVDSTRSYGDSIGASLVARSDTYAGTVGRTQFSIRNTRIGMMLESPVIGGVKPSAVIEADFSGNQPIEPGKTSEATAFASPILRLRNAYVRLQNDYVDVLAGQTYDVFGWQNYFFPCSIEFLGLPNQLFSRNVQLKLSHTFNATGALSVDVAASAVRPAQQDSMVPDINGGVRFGVNKWKGISTPGNTGTVVLPASIGVSGTLRQFKVNAFTPPPVQTSNSVMGWGLSVDALVPVIPASSANDRGNSLTLIGSFVTGAGIGDLITATGGAEFPTLPNPAQANPPPLYNGDIDHGIVSFDTQGVLRTIDWQAFKVGVQYYFPPTGRLILSANYTQARSSNMAKLFPKGGAEIELLGRVASWSQYADVNVFFDVTPAARIGVSGQYTSVEYLDGDKPHNLRAMGQALYAF